MIRGVLFIFLIITFSSAKEYVLNLEQTISLALKNNITNRISKHNLEIAKAQYKQALSANYPSIEALVYVNRDKDNAIMQQRSTIELSSSVARSLALANTLSLPAGSQAAAQATINAAPDSSFEGQTMDISSDPIAKGRDTFHSEINIKYPLYTGGKISSKIEQAKLNTLLAKQSIVKDRHQLIYDVKKYYYGYILTSKLYVLVQEIYDDMQFSIDLTKNFLEEDSSLKIKRTDYLNMKLTTSLIHSTLTKIKLNKELLLNAISNLIGLKWDDKLKLISSEEEIKKFNKGLEELIKKAALLNTDISKINLALQIKEKQIDEEQSNNYPQVGLYANVSHTLNSYEYGYLNEDNEDNWKIGIAIKMSLFDGFRTKNKILEKRIERKIVNEQKILLEEGISTKLKNEFLKSSIGYEQINILKESMKIATENSDLNLSGFEYEMVEAKDVIQSQLTEVYVKADYYKYVHDYLVSLAMIDKLVGEKIYENN